MFKMIYIALSDNLDCSYFGVLLINFYILTA